MSLCTAGPVSQHLKLFGRSLIASLCSQTQGIDHGGAWRRYCQGSIHAAYQERASAAFDADDQRHTGSQWHHESIQGRA